MTSGNLPRIIVKLNQSVEILNKSIREQLSADIGNLSQELKNNYSPILNLRKAFGSSEGIQKKALSINSNLLKVTTVNAESLKKMNGSFFDNAEDLLKNFSEGIRENSDGLNDLLVRMRLTGQDQAVAREMARSMLELTGKDIVAVDRLSKNTVKLSNDYVISSESLIDAINSLKSSMDIPSVFGLADDMAGVAMELSARMKGLGKEDLQKTLGFIFDSSLDSIPAKIALGLGDPFEILSQNISDSQKADQIIERLNAGVDAANKTLKVQEGAYRVNLTQYQFGRYMQADQLTAMIRTNDLLKSSNDLTDKMRGDSNDYTKTIENVNKEALNFYAKSSEWYPAIIKLLENTSQGIAGGAAGGALGSLVGLGAGMRGVGGALRLASRFLGPIGIAVGTILPLVLPKLLGSDDEKDKQLKEAEKARKAVESIDKKTRDQSASKEEASSTNQYLRTAAQSLNDIVSRMNNSQYNNQLKVLEKQVSMLEKINKELKTSNNKGF